MFSFNQIGWWSQVVSSMCFSLVIRGQKGSMEDRVNSPLVGEFQPVSVGRDHLDDIKWSFSFGGKFPGRVSDLQIFGV